MIDGVRLAGRLMCASGVAAVLLAIVAHAAGEPRDGGRWNTHGDATWVLAVLGSLLLLNGLAVLWWQPERSIEEEERARLDQAARRAEGD